MYVPLHSSSQDLPTSPAPLPPHPGHSGSPSVAVWLEEGVAGRLWQKEVFWFLSKNKLLFYILILREGHTVRLPI